MMIEIDAYMAALNGAAYINLPQAGYLRVGDRDRVDFLQRQTTNDLNQLSPDRSVTTVLTSPTARILDVLCVIDEGESLGVITLPGRAPETAKFLRGRIFFSDRVDVEDRSAEIAQVLLFGFQTEDVLAQFGIKPMALGDVICSEIASQPVTWIADKVLTDTSYRLLVPAPFLDLITAKLDEVGVISMKSDTFEILRVEAGQPGPVELVDAYTPLEMGLHDLISDSKGCYTGQEIIARQITYDKVTKNLVGIKLSDLVANGGDIRIKQKSIGTLTSVVQSPRFGIIGLGVVRRQHSDPGSDISILGTDGLAIDGEVARIPF